MKKGKSGDILSFIDNIVHDKTQVEGDSIYLTIGKISRLIGRGDIDFGGSEYLESEKREMNSVKRKPEDKYGWWILEMGEYLVEFNEKLQDVTPKDKVVILQPSERLTKTGVFHPTKVLQKKGEIKTILYVGRNGVNIKENAKVSKIVVLD
jgi:hypothetical protein